MAEREVCLGMESGLELRKRLSRGFFYFLFLYPRISGVLVFGSL